MLTEENINANFVNFVTRLEKYGMYTDSLKEDVEFNELLKKASAFTSVESGGAYEGSLIEHITRIAIIAFGINKLLLEEIRVNAESLVKVCHIHQLSKAIMIVENKVDWEVKKGKIFTFKNDLPAIKTGEYSIYLANKYGIELTEDEYSAILSIDKDDDQTKYFSSTLSEILRKSIELANNERRFRHKFYSK